MKLITLGRRRIDLRQYVRRGALESDAREKITEPCKVFDKEGQLVCIYDILQADTTSVTEALHKIEYQTSTRTGGLVTTSRIFGYSPRLERRQRSYCSRTSLARQQPHEHATICGVAKAISQRYELMSGDVYDKHRQLMSDVKPEWRIKGSVFTSGIINKNNALKYHHDSGNFEGVLSAMLVLRDGMSGGWLVLPEFDAKFFLHNNSIFMFDGQEILHGVTPMQKEREDGYRYSLVFYSLRGMWKCLTLTEELAQARQREMEKFT